MVVDVGEALFIKGSSASISSPPKGADSTGMLLYKSIVAAMPSTTLTKLQKDQRRRKILYLTKIKEQVLENKTQSNKKI